MAIKKRVSVPKKKDAGRRRDYQVNDVLVSSKFCELLLKHQKMPAYSEVAKELGVSAKTVERHVKMLDVSDRFAKYRTISDKVVLNLFKQAATGTNAHCIRLWLEFIEGMGNKKKVEIEMSMPEVILPGDEL